MFRCTLKATALAIDLESFSEFRIDQWSPLTQLFKCLFLVSNEENKRRITASFPNAYIHVMKPYDRPFGPAQMLHFSILKELSVQATEAVYISHDFNFLNNAMAFLGGTAWLTESINYAQASNCPDLIFSTFDHLQGLSLGKNGFVGEKTFLTGQLQGVFAPVAFNVRNRNAKLYMLGRYFGHQHYMRQLHPYSTAISTNKNARSKSYRKFDPIFTDLFASAYEQIEETKYIDGIVSVPNRPSEENRFDRIVGNIANRCNIENLNSHFHCIKNYPHQRGKSNKEREENIKGVFSYSGDLSGKNIIIIDDVITTGATIRECVQELYAQNAANVTVMVLAINQKATRYWRADWPQISCPKCGKPMELRVNSTDKSFFYGCSDHNCKKTISFDQGRELLCSFINSEQHNYSDERE